MNQYVKIRGHDNWFLVLHPNSNEPEKLSENMQEQILRSQVCALHHDTPDNKQDLIYRIKLAATRNLNYEELANKYGTILIRHIGSYTLLKYSEIIEEKYDTDFPIDEFADIVICENDENAEYVWIKYLQNKFPGKKIVTINFFNLKSDETVKKYFDHAKYITFSTTFSDYIWFEKLSKHVTNQKIIGYCHDKSNWKHALKINKNIEIVKNI